MDKFSTIDDKILFHRLDEIDGEFQDWHISAYKSDLLSKEQKELKEELLKRGYTIKQQIELYFSGKEIGNDLYSTIRFLD